MLLLLNLMGKKKLLLTLFVLSTVAVSLVFRFHPYLYYGILFSMGMNFYLIMTKENSTLNHFLIISSLIVAISSKNIEIIIVTFILILTMYLLVYDFLKFLNLKPLLFLGNISYALYLIHQNFGHSIQNQLISFGVINPIVLILLPFTLSIIVAWIITEFIERPLLKSLKKRIT